MKYDFAVEERKKIRLVISADAKNEVDDQFVIVHAMLTDKFIVKGIVASHYEQKQKEDSMIDSYNEIIKVLSLMGIDYDKIALMGGESAILDEKTPQISEGAEFIVKEAMKEDENPLYVICIGALTDLASAYLMEPEIADKIKTIWVGGGEYPDGHPEFNISNDVVAADVVFKSDIPLWQVPVSACASFKVSFAEIQYKVKPYGRIGEYLFERLLESNEEDWTYGESWVMWDHSALALLLEEHMFHFDIKPAPSITRDMHYIHGQDNREIRVYRRLDPRFIFEDFFCKLAINYGNM